MIDITLSNILSKEHQRQASELELIASENYVSAEVLAAYSNIFTNKYSEGYPGARYYGGQEYVDQLERLTQHRALRVFGLLARDALGDETQADESQETIVRELADAPWAVNVQPLSGGPANAAVYIGLLRAGDTILAMDLAAGGHLSHGHKLNLSGQNYTIVSYGVNQKMDGLDYEDIRTKALECKPSIIVAGYSAFVGTIAWHRFAQIADEVQAVHGYRPVLMADIAHIAGLIAGGVMAGPFADFDIVTTTTHKTLRGPRGALIYTRKGMCTMSDGRTLDREKTINRGVFPGLQGGPHMHLVYAKAVALREAMTAEFASYTQSVLTNSKILARELLARGWPILTGTTCNHMVLMDVTKRLVHIGEPVDGMYDVDLVSTNLTGKSAEKILEEIGISVNKNMLPNDERTPMDPSGLRLGTPALTTRGMGESEVIVIAEIIDEALRHGPSVGLRRKVALLSENFPIV